MLTNNEIIKAAFKVWGRNFYRTTSLTDIARELGVSKPALYRHFRDKDALLGEMFTTFFDDFAAFIREAYGKALAAGNQRESGRIMMRVVSEYYIRNRDTFIFSLTKVHNSLDKDNISREFLNRGIDFRNLAYGRETPSFYPSKTQLIMVTVIFYIGLFHRSNEKSDEIPTDEKVSQVLADIEDRIKNGLGLHSLKASALDYGNLEREASVSLEEAIEHNVILKAVASAVAEAGPWDASMEMVARRSGLSKSSLYAHFKNKQDMLAQFFFTEFNKIINFARMKIERIEKPEEQLYLAIISIVNYLRSSPEILLAIDWLKTRPLELEKELPSQLYKVIASIKLEAIQKKDLHALVIIGEWILFLIVNTLAWWQTAEISGQGLAASCQRLELSKTWAKNAVEVPNESFRILYRFIALGLGGIPGNDFPEPAGGLN